MKKGLVLFFVGVLTLGALLFIIYLQHLSFALIVMKMKTSTAKEVLFDQTIELILLSTGATLIISFINYLIIKFSKVAKHPFKIILSLALSVLIGSGISLYYARENFKTFQEINH